MVYTLIGYRFDDFWQRRAVPRQRFQLFCRAPPAQGRFDTPQPLCYLPAMLATPRFMVVLGSILLWAAAGCGDSSRPQADPESAAREEAYRGQVTLSGLGLAKGENFLGDEVIYVKGSLTNDGEATIRRVELTFLFKDSLDQVVLKEARTALEYRGKRGIAPQQAAEFQVAFENLPRDWNYVVPEIQVSGIGLR